jgi:hypothetical protein
VDTPLGLPEKFLLIVAGALSLATGLLLYIFPARTDLYFAWTIRNPLTAVFMGASYLAGIGTFWALSGGSWREMRVQMPFMLAFGTLQLLATLLNLSTFNFGHLLGWAWLAVYAISAPLAWFLYVRNERRFVAARALLREGGPAGPAANIAAAASVATGSSLGPVSDSTVGALSGAPAVNMTPTAPAVPAASGPLIILLLLATLHIVVGLALFVLPGAMAGVWPWGLTQLTAQVIGGWYIAGGISVWARVRTRTPAHPETGQARQTGQIAGFLVAPLLLIGAWFFRRSFSGPPLAVGLYLADVILAGALLIYARLQAGRRQLVGTAE